MEETPSDWLCKVCGKSDNKGKFCSRCGTPQGAWNCLTCGQEGNTGKFCPKCGTPGGTWSCSACGTSGNTGRFCPKCGAGRPEPRTIEGLEHEAETPESSMGPAAMGDAIPAAPEETDFTSPTARETSETAATTGDTPPSAPMSKRTKLILALIAFVAVAYWSFGIVTEKLYEAKEKEFLTIMTDSRTLFASLDALSGDAAAEEAETTQTASERKLIQCRFQSTCGGNSGGFQPIEPRRFSRTIPIDAGEIRNRLPRRRSWARRVKVPILLEYWAEA